MQLWLLKFELLFPGVESDWTTTDEHVTWYYCKSEKCLSVDRNQLGNSMKIMDIIYFGYNQLVRQPTISPTIC